MKKYFLIDDARCSNIFQCDRSIYVHMIGNTGELFFGNFSFHFIERLAEARKRHHANDHERFF